MTNEAVDTARPSKLVSALVPIAALVIGGGLIAHRVIRGEAPPPPGAPFALIDARTGEPFTEQSLIGQPTALFFGFTACPDVCPTGLATAARWHRALGADASKLRIAFVTVDPERDTAERMAGYVGAFQAPIVGVTGPRTEVDRAIARFGIIATKVPQGDSYTYDHTALLLLIDRRGQTVSTLDLHDDDEATAVSRLRALIGTSS